MAYKRNVEIFEEAYEKKDAKSVVSYVARDGRKRYIAGSKSPDGGGTPMPSGGMEEVTWQELKDKRDAGKLTPGSLYRITDYNCTTTQENTQSAGHQFDIVLLALSENKLAEEGWAMMHDNIYDVTFADGVTKKCWIYKTPDFDNIVDINTLLGTQDISLLEDANINEETKTIIITNEQYTSSYLSVEDIPYNYFQHSNLSAWKVWYCLDNDKSRFAWADDSVIGDIENIVVYYPERFGLGGTVPAHDAVYTLTNETQIVNGVTYFKLIKLEGVHSDMVELLVDTKNINTETTLYEFDSRSGTAKASPWNISIKSINYNTPPTEEGRGVIYRLIDEWNNDVGYDFKNILYLRNIKYDDGAIVLNDGGRDIYIPTFCLYDIADDEYKDASIFAIDYENDEGGIQPCYANTITRSSGYDSLGDFQANFGLTNVVIIDKVENADSSWGANNNVIRGTSNFTFYNISSIIAIGAYNVYSFMSNLEETIILSNKIVSTQNIS